MFGADITGQIEEIGEVQRWRDAEGKERVKCEIVLIDGHPKWPNRLAVAFWNGDIERLDSYQRGDIVDVKVRMRSRPGHRRDGTTYWATTVTGYDISPYQPNVETGGEPAPVDAVEENVPF